MMRHASSGYITLQDYLPPSDQRMVSKSVITVLPTAEPSPEFVMTLQDHLINEAKHRQAAHIKAIRRLRIAGFLSVGAILTVGITLLFMYLRRQQHDA